MTPVERADRILWIVSGNPREGGTMNETYTQSQRLTAFAQAEPAMLELCRQNYATLLPSVPYRSARLRERLIVALLERWPALSHPQIGKLIGCEQSTVARCIQRLRKREREEEVWNAERAVLSPFSLTAIGCNYNS